MLVLFSAGVLNSSTVSAQGPFGGGGPPPFGGEGGGPPFGGGWGGRGESGGWGGRGSRGEGGGRGGFDPGAMLSRMDANGNKMIDPDEAQGPARFMLDRIARDNPDIDLSKPVPLTKITEAFEKSRGSRGSLGGGGSEGDDAPPVDEKKTLVPGFGVAKTPDPLPGFGTEADKFSVKIDARDLKEAEDRINRYDKNKDGSLDEDELKDGRWNDSPMQYDRNHDKKLSKQELAVRYARRRMNDSSKSNESDIRSGSDSRRSGWNDASANNGEKSNETEVANLWKNQSSLRTTPRSGKLAKVQGLPEWFVSNDQNGDGQVMMNEFSSAWDKSVVDEFNRFDLNRDGIITYTECLTAVKKGVLRGVAAASTSSSSTSSTVRSTGSGSTSGSISTSVSGSSTASTGSSIDLSKFKPEDIPGNAEEKWIKFCLKNISKMDKNGDLRMTPDEWASNEKVDMFNNVDVDKDGQVSLVEYYNYRSKRLK